MVADESFWSKGAIDASIIVIDDPQRELTHPANADQQSPRSSRSSRRSDQRPSSSSGRTSKVRLAVDPADLAVQSNLTDDPSTPQYRTWNYLFHFIKDVDLFLAVSSTSWASLTCSTRSNSSCRRMCTRISRCCTCPRRPSE